MHITFLTPEPSKTKSAVKEAEEFLSDFNFKIDAVKFPIKNLPKEFYYKNPPTGNDLYGIDRSFIRSLINSTFKAKTKAQEEAIKRIHEVFVPQNDEQARAVARTVGLPQGENGLVIHAPDFEMQGAAGWYYFENGISIMQVYSNFDMRTYGRNNEVSNRLTQVLVHEALHMLYNQKALIDNTHQWVAENCKRCAVDELLAKTRIERWFASFLNRFKNTLEVEQDYYVVHHSGSTVDTVNGIRNYHEPKFGRIFYNAIIDRQGKLHELHDKWNIRGHGFSKDVCLLGDFTQHPPAQSQIRTLKKYLGGKPWITHAQAHKFGLAEYTECPGNLEKYL